MIERVVSLVPSVTETLSVWGREPVACTRFCERPDLPHVGGTKNPDIDAIVALEPELVVVDRQENRRQDADALAARGIAVLDLDVRRVEGLAGELARLATAVGLDIEADVDVDPPVPAVAVRWSAFVPIWRRPWMTVGPNTYGSSLLERVGVANVFADAARDYPEVTLDEVADRSPDVVLAPNEPYDFTDEHLAELAAIAPVVEIDGQDLFWWGARTPAAIERLRAAVDALPRRHR